MGATPAKYLGVMDYPGQSGWYLPISAVQELQVMEGALINVTTGEPIETHRLGLDALRGAAPSRYTVGMRGRRPESRARARRPPPQSATRHLRGPRLTGPLRRRLLPAL